MQHRYDRSARTPPVCCSELVNVNQMNCHCSCSTKLSACGGLKRFYTSSRSFSIINTRMKRLISWLEVQNTFVFSSKWLSVYETVRAEKAIRWSGDQVIVVQMWRSWAAVAPRDLQLDGSWWWNDHSGHGGTALVDIMPTACSLKTCEIVLCDKTAPVQ